MAVDDWKRIGRIATVVVPIVGAAVWLGVLAEKVRRLEESGLPKATLDSLAAIKDQTERSLDALDRALVPGSIVASYADGPVPPHGWVVCGTDGTPKLDGKFLIGTSDFTKVRTPRGSESHWHETGLDSTGERDGRFRSGAPNTPDDFADNVHRCNGCGARNWFHRHRIEEPTGEASSLPPSISVMFYCRLLDTQAGP